MERIDVRNVFGQPGNPSSAESRDDAAPVPDRGRFSITRERELSTTRIKSSAGVSGVTMRNRSMLEPLDFRAPVSFDKSIMIRRKYQPLRYPYSFLSVRKSSKRFAATSGDGLAVAVVPITSLGVPVDEDGTQNALETSFFTIRD